MKTNSQPKRTFDFSKIGLFTIYAVGLAIIVLQLRSILSLF